MLLNKVIDAKNYVNNKITVSIDFFIANIEILKKNKILNYLYNISLFN